MDPLKYSPTPLPWSNYFKVFGPFLKQVDPHGIKLLLSIWTPGATSYFRVVLKYLDTF